MRFIFLSFTDYPDYSQQQDYSQYAGQVKYEQDEQKFRPADRPEQGNGSNYEYQRQDYWVVV